MNNIILETIDLKKYFIKTIGLRKKLILKAVDNVTIKVTKGETLGIIGESGSGKTTLGKTILKLYTPTDGKILFQQKDITNLPEKSIRPLRKHMQIVYQDPYSSLNPRMKIGDLIARPLKIHKITSTENETRKRVKQLLEEVQLSPELMERYPHELSGGQRQRVAIARAIATEPDLIVLDEPTSALDVSVQAQILSLLKYIQKKHNTSYIFISHDIAVVSYISNRIAVMYMGQIVEEASTEELINDPKHPYTRMLLGVIPKPDPREKIPETLELGEPELPINPPPLCRFRRRCREKLPLCETKEPPYTIVAKDHRVKCWLYNKRFSD